MSERDTTGYFANRLYCSGTELVSEFRHWGCWKLKPEMVTQITLVPFQCAVIALKNFCMRPSPFSTLSVMSLAGTPVKTPCVARFFCLVCDRDCTEMVLSCLLQSGLQVKEWAGVTLAQQPTNQPNHKPCQIQNLDIWKPSQLRDAIYIKTEDSVSAKWRITCESTNTAFGVSQFNGTWV